MCGIAGSINQQIGEKCLSLIKHRGPDSQGLVTINIGSHSVNFGHTRLAIVDLSAAGNQPMYSDCGNYCIVFNGEIYNHELLRKKIKGVKFNGHSDTETILYFIREFGIESVKEFNGIFAFAFADIKNQKIYLVRDRFGVKPLYYSIDDNKLLFSSELRLINAGFQPKINTGALANVLQMRYTPAPFTIYKGVKKNEPGQVITFLLDSDTIRVEKKYFLLNQPGKKRKEDYGFLLKEYGDLFEKAVERQLMADVDIGILLSGGVDSALVAAIAKDKSVKPIKAFTIGFEGDHADIDEIKYARDTAKILGLDHYFKKIGFDGLFNSIEKITEITEEPIATTSIIPMYYLSELAASHVKVVLSGQGADEPLGGYDKYRYLGYLEKGKYFKGLNSFIGMFESTYGKNEKSRRFFSSLLSKDLLTAYKNYNSIFSLPEISALIQPSKRADLLSDLQNLENEIIDTWKSSLPQSKKIRDAFLAYDLRTSLSDDLLMYTDKITMHFSLECRVPVLDNDLIEFIESLKPKYKLTTKKGKIIHKDFAREYLPAHIINRKKLGFQSPVDTWFSENMESIKNLMMSGNRFFNVFDKKGVLDLLKEHVNGKNYEKQIFLLLSVFYTMENMKNE